MTKVKKPTIKGLQKQLAEANDAMLRERADAMNIRKRADEEKIKLGSFYKGLVVKEILPVIDNFERSLKSIPEDLQDNEYIKGIKGIIEQFEETLRKLGVEKIRTVGNPFDPELHQAVTVEEGGEGEEIVSGELQSGYRMDKEIIRHAMVKVKKVPIDDLAL